MPAYIVCDCEVDDMVGLKKVPEARLLAGWSQIESPSTSLTQHEVLSVRTVSRWCSSIRALLWSLIMGDEG